MRPPAYWGCTTSVELKFPGPLPEGSGFIVRKDKLPYLCVSLNILRGCDALQWLGGEMAQLGV